MKKFLVFAALLAVNYAHTSMASCALRNSANCATPEGFATEQQAGCAGANTNCRITFCSKVCGNPQGLCPSDPATYAVCSSACTGIGFKDGLVQAKLRECFGAIASQDEAAAMSTLSKALEPGLSQFKTLAAKTEEYAVKASEAKQALVQLSDQLEAAGRQAYPSDPTLAHRLLTRIIHDAQMKAGTFVAEEAVPAYTSRRSARRLAAAEASRAAPQLQRQSTRRLLRS